MRTHFLRRVVAPEMLALSLVELILTFMLALILLTPSLSSPDLPSINFAMLCALAVCFIAFVVGLYRPQIFERARSLLVSSLLSALLSFPAVWLISKALGLSSYWPVGYDPLRPLKIVFIWSVGVVGTRLTFMLAARLGFFVHRVAIIGHVEAPSVAAVLTAGRTGFLEIMVVDPKNATGAKLTKCGIRTLVVAGEARKSLLPTTLVECERVGIKIQDEAYFWERYLRRVDIADVERLQSTVLTEQQLSRVSEVLSRCFDLCVSIVLLVATLPIMCVVAILIRLDSSGPILYQQERVGLDHTPFTLLKFRSMRIDAEAAGPKWAQQKDPRVTRVGSFIRKTRIDELPQLINILRGEMSFIGPRPERPHFVEQLTQVIPGYQQRSRVKPGLTGWAQVNYPYGASVDDAKAKLSYDLYYVKNRTFLLDLLILLATIRVILLQEGAR